MNYNVIALGDHLETFYLYFNMYTCLAEAEQKQTSTQCIGIHFMTVGITSYVHT